MNKPVRIFSFLCLIGFIVGAVAGNWRYFLDYVGLVLLAVALHDALAFGTGYACARLSGLPDYDRRAVSIEVGIRNAGLGLVLIVSFFCGLGGMAVVAGVWGFWDIIAGLTLAGWWGCRPAQLPPVDALGEQRTCPAWGGKAAAFWSPAQTAFWAAAW